MILNEPDFHFIPVSKLYKKKERKEEELLESNTRPESWVYFTFHMAAGALMDSLQF